jgi:hypothetical protein
LQAFCFRKEELDEAIQHLEEAMRLFTNSSIDGTAKELSKFKVCKEGMAQKGKATQSQVDYEIENNKKYRGVAKRYHNKNNE